MPSSWATGLEVKLSVALGAPTPVCDPDGSVVASGGKVELVGDGESSPSEDELLSDSSSGMTTGDEVAGSVLSGGVATGTEVGSGSASETGGTTTGGTSSGGGA